MSSSSLLPSLLRAPAMSVLALGLLGASAVAAIPVSSRGPAPDVRADASESGEAGPPAPSAAPADAADVADAALAATAARFDDRPDPASFVPAVLDAVAARDGLPLADGSACPETGLQLAFTAPTGDFVEGAHVEPLGPVPAEGVDYSAGVVQCAGSTHAYLGFEAVWELGAWDVSFVPDLGDDHGDEHFHDEESLPPPVQPSTPVGTTGEQLQGHADGPPIEGYARYEPQSTCDPTAKAGTLELRSLLLARYPVSTSLGISRSCSTGGRSEHKEGRAFDWGVNVHDTAQRAAAEDFLAQLLATDQYSNDHAVARRMGVMYVIWDRQIWSSYQADAGWRAYSGASAHTDHVHISLSWAGARGSTSFWSGEVVDGLSPVSDGGGGSGTDGGTVTGVVDDSGGADGGGTGSDEHDGGEGIDGGPPAREDDEADERRQREEDEREREEREREREERERERAREREEREQQKRESSRAEEPATSESVGPDQGRGRGGGSRGGDD